MDKIEEKAADVVLQKPMKVKIGGKTYTVARPTLGTLVAISHYVKQLHGIDGTKSAYSIPSVLHAAGDDGVILAKIAAVLILGAKGLRESGGLKRKILSFRKHGHSKGDIEALSQELLDEASPKEICGLVKDAISYQKIGFFLNAIISLTGENILAPTKKDTEATASGE